MQGGPGGSKTQGKWEEKPAEQKQEKKKPAEQGWSHSAPPPQGHSQSCAWFWEGPPSHG